MCNYVGEKLPSEAKTIHCLKILHKYRAETPDLYRTPARYCLAGTKWAAT